MTVMDSIPALLIIWAAISACFLGLLAYKGQLTRYEEDQLFLSDIRAHEQQLQGEIIRKVTKIQPFVRVFGIASAIMTASCMRKACRSRRKRRRSWARSDSIRRWRARSSAIAGACSATSSGMRRSRSSRRSS